MKYTRNQLNKAGDALIGQDPFERQKASDIVSKWRETHLPVLRAFEEQFSLFLIQNGIVSEFSSKRIKRMTSIVEKLRNGQSTNMKLGGLQDIGGIRFVFNSISTLDKVNALMPSFKAQGFELKKTNDYVSMPKPSGYRSSHYIFKYSSENEDYNGLQIELQVRTKLQHCWAMAVETASLISRTSLKANIEDGSVWREFFKLISAVFAWKEGKPVNEMFRDYTHEKYCLEYFKFQDEHKLLDQLKALRVTVNFDKHKEIEKGACVLIVNFSKKVVHFQQYATEDEINASNLFTDIEKNITEDEAALMVSMEKIKELKQAYPSYFLDTEEFVNSLDSFGLICQVFRS